jgi:DNA-binding NarL/FixJ family response regulator
MCDCVLKLDKIKILIVGETDSERQELSAFLRLFHFDVQLAAGVDDTLRCLTQADFQVVFLEMDFPQVSGLELIKKIRAIHPERPKILITNDFSALDVSALFAAGADGFFLKPFHAAAVRAVVQLVLLNRMERWVLPLSPPAKIVSTHKLAARGRSLSDEKLFVFGRQGFFLRGDYPHFSIEDRIEFDFTFEAKEPIERLRGVGVVRWCEASGVGIEVLQIDAPQIGKFVSWLEGAAGPTTIPKA